MSYDGSSSIATPSSTAVRRARGRNRVQGMQAARWVRPCAYRSARTGGCSPRWRAPATATPGRITTTNAAPWSGSTAAWLARSVHPRAGQGAAAARWRRRSCWPLRATRRSLCSTTTRSQITPYRRSPVPERAAPNPVQSFAHDPNSSLRPKSAPPTAQFPSLLEASYCLT